VRPRLGARVDDDGVPADEDRLALMNLALAEEAERYRTLYETAPVAFITTDDMGKVIEGNAAACRLLGVEGRFLMGKPLATFVDPSSRREFRQSLLSVRRDGLATELTLRMRRRRGVAFEGALRASAGHDGELLWTVEDVTERTQGEQRIWELNRELEAQVAIRTAELEAVVDQMPIGLLVVDRDLRRLRTNRRARDLLGDERDPIGVVRDGSGEVVSVEERPATRALRGETLTAERYEVMNGSERLVLEVSAVPIQSERGITGAVVTLDDVTEQDRRARADQDFVTNAAHQIRTPITAIAAAVAALEAGAKRDEGARDRFIFHIDEAVTRLSSTAEALLTLSRIERGDAAAQSAVVRICPLLERLARSTGGDRISVACGQDVAAVTHEGLLQEALASILDNALQHTAGAVVLRGWRDGAQTYIEVADEGPGMKHELRRRAFDRFVTGGRGAGLGLSIAAAAVRAAGAKVQLEAGPAQGTVARISLTSARMLT
jgi:two-component system phosphate regulon sensor histidine kinase PhoR